MATKATTSKSNKKKSLFYAYILECADKTLYIGATNNLDRRIQEHNGATAGAKYTRGRRPVILRYTEVLDTFGASRAREAALKRLSREEKLLLCASKTALLTNDY